MKALTLACSLFLLAAVTPAQQAPTATPYGQSCGPVLSCNLYPTGTAHHVGIKVTKAFPSSFGFMMWGVTRLNLPLFDGCSLYTDYVWGHSIRTDIYGKVTSPKSWPLWAVGKFYVQVFMFKSGTTNPMVIKSTNGLFLERKP